MTTTAAGTARGGMTMDETTRLRALLEGIALPWRAQPTVVDGDEVECSALVLCPYGDDGDTTTVAEIDMGHDIECDDAHAALIVAAVNAFPGLLDAAERAERAERERDDLRATLETRNAEHALAMERVRELEAIIAGRTTPPTDAEIEAHWRACGAWLSEGARMKLRSVAETKRHREIESHARAVLWIPLDADGRPCAWPTAEVSRG